MPVFSTQSPETQARSRSRQVSHSPAVDSSLASVSLAGHPIIQRKTSCACGGGCPVCQAKSNLNISQPNDPAEIEADQIADRVMRMSVKDASPTPHPSNASGTVHRKCGGCEDEEELTESPVMRKKAFASAAPASPPGTPPLINNVINSGGRPLDLGTRRFFEPRIGCGLSSVRIFTDSAAGQSAESIQARAYTLGNNIIFGHGEYSPGSERGKHLLAHELAHVAQQSQGSSAVGLQRQAAPGSGSTTAPATTPTFGASCSGGATDPCQQSRCTTPITDINADLSQAIAYVDSAIAALGTTPLAAGTRRALDWYFNSQTDETVATVLARLTCTRNELQDTLSNGRFGCHPGDSALAYVCVSQMSPCQSSRTNVCLTNKYFSKSDRVRTEVLIHECAHRAGLSTGSDPHLYDFHWAFMFLDTADSLMNADSYALFATSVTEGVRTTLYGFPYLVGLSGGAALPSVGESTWQARLYVGTEFQHPILGLVNPTVGVGLSLIGETTTGGPLPVTSPTSFLASLVGGFRLMDARPGAAGGGYASFFGGPAIVIPSFQAGRSNDVRLGAEAGVGIGYRWRWLDVSAGINYAYDPTREAGMEHLLLPNVSITFAPFGFGQLPSSH